MSPVCPGVFVHVGAQVVSEMFRWCVCVCLVDIFCRFTSFIVMFAGI